jgi:hypothetical protein
MKRAIPLIMLFLLTGLAAPRAQSFELSPFYGYRVGGDFDDVPSSVIKELETQHSDSYGLTFGYAFNDRFELEGLWSMQDTELKVFLSPGGSELLDFEVQYFHVGGLVLSGDSLDTKRAFFSFSAGVVSFDPEMASSETYFSWSIGGGGKFYFNDWLGLRLQGRFFPTYINSTTNGYFCGYYGCYQTADSNFLTQTEFTVGLIFRFGY